jgi:hypothetical protein
VALEANLLAGGEVSQTAIFWIEGACLNQSRQKTLLNVRGMHETHLQPATKAETAGGKRIGRLLMLHIVQWTP